MQPPRSTLLLTGPHGRQFPQRPVPSGLHSLWAPSTAAPRAPPWPHVAIGGRPAPPLTAGMQLRAQSTSRPPPALPACPQGRFLSCCSGTALCSPFGLLSQSTRGLTHGSALAAASPLGAARAGSARRGQLAAPKPCPERPIREREDMETENKEFS